MTTLSCCVSTIHPNICIGVSIVQAAVQKMFSYWQLVGLMVFSGDKIVYWDAELTRTVSQIYRNQYMYIEHSHVQPAVEKMFKLSISWFGSSSFLVGLYRCFTERRHWAVLCHQLIPTSILLLRLSRQLLRKCFSLQTCLGASPFWWQDSFTLRRSWAFLNDQFNRSSLLAFRYRQMYSSEDKIALLGDGVELNYIANSTEPVLSAHHTTRTLWRKYFSNQSWFGASLFLVNRLLSCETDFSCSHGKAAVKKMLFAISSWLCSSFFLVMKLSYWEREFSCSVSPIHSFQYSGISHVNIAVNKMF